MHFSRLGIIAALMGGINARGSPLPEPREPEPYSPRRPINITPGDEIEIARRRQLKRARKAAQKTVRAGIPGNGLWRRNNAHGRVRGW